MGGIRMVGKVESPNFVPSAKDDNFVQVSAIDGGSLTLPERYFVTPASLTASQSVPSLCFLITHPGATSPFLPGRKPQLRRFMFDLGLRSDYSGYTTPQQQHIETRKPVSLPSNLSKRLEVGGLSVEDIEFVILSHVHWDHTGNPSEFPKAAFIVGHGSSTLLRDGMPGRGSHSNFDAALLPEYRSFELPDPLNQNASGQKGSIFGTFLPLGPFPGALDLFKDGSVFVVDCPGHLPGHVNLLCRVGPQKWVYLGGDACHDPRLLTGEREIGTWKGEVGETLCIHSSKEGAQQSIGRIRSMTELFQQAGHEVTVIFTHDVEWAFQNQAKMYPNVI